MNNSLSHGTQALRKGRYSCPGQVYFITSVCKNRNPLFGNDFTARITKHCLLEARTWPDAKCLAWVIMPDHVHAIIRLGKKESLSLVVQRMKSLIATRINEHMGFSQACWQRGFHDHAIAADQPILGFVQYIIDNPLRAGLVENAGDYAYAWLDDLFL